MNREVRDTVTTLQYLLMAAGVMLGAFTIATLADNDDPPCPTVPVVAMRWCYIERTER